MKVARAVQILQRQKEALKTANKDTAPSWKVQVESYVGTFFGFDSPEFKFIAEHSFSGAVFDITDYYVDQQKPFFNSFVDNCITTVQDKGLYKKGNFLSRVSENWLIAIIVILIPGLLTIGTIFGKYLSDTQNIEIKQQVKDSSVELLRLRTSIQKLSNSKSAKKTDSTSSAQ